MFAQYRAAYTPEGAAAFSVAAFVSRFSIAIYPIALVLIVSARTGDYGFSGVISGVFVIGEAAGNPVAGRLVDRFGQHRVLPIYLGAHLVSTVLMAILLTVKTPLWTLTIAALLMGASMLNIGALVRARWSYVWPVGSAERTTAYSVESTLDEVIFVFGPLLATVLATRTSPVITLVLAMALIATGSSWLAAQRDTEPPVRVHVPGEKRLSAMSQRGMLHIAVVMAFMGAVFGSCEVVIVAFTGQHGERTGAGWVLACFAFGSGTAGLIYGSRRWKASPLRRFVVSSSVFSVLPLLFFLATNVPMLAVITVVVGLGIAPTLIGGFGLVDSIVPPGALTEGLTWIGTGLSIGFGIGASLGGGFADAHGARTAFLLPALFAVGAAAAAVTLAHRLAPRGESATYPAAQAEPAAQVRPAEQAQPV